MRRTIFAATVLAAVAAGSGSIVGDDSAKSLYDQKCAMCHGIDGVAKAMGKGSKNFNDPAFNLSSEEIVRVTLDGKGKMPKLAGKLTPEQAKLVADYVKTLRPQK